MSDRRRKDVNWLLNTNDDGTVEKGQASLAVLMDIRDELQQLNRLLGCRNVATGFRALTRIARLEEKTFQRRVNAAVRRVNAAVRRRLKAKT